MRNAPLGDGGMDVNIITGRPIAPENAAAAKVEKLEADVAEGERLRLDLLDADSESNIAVRGIVDQLIVRIDALASADVVCRALTDILQSIGMQVHLGPLCARRKLGQLMGNDFAHVFAPKTRDTGRGL